MTEEVVKREKMDVVPSFLESADLGDKTGLESIDSTGMKMQRLAVAQKMHSQVDEDNVDYIPGLKPGMFFNKLTKEIYGKGPILITPLIAKHHRRLFSARDAGSKTLCVSDNAINGGRLSPLCSTCKKSHFGWDKEKGVTKRPDCTEFWSYLIVMHTEDGLIPLSISLKSMMLDSALEFNTWMKNRRIGGKVAPAYTGLYEMNSFLDTSAPAGPFHNVKIINAGWVPEEKFTTMKMMFDEFAPKIDEVVAELIGEEDERSSNSNDDDDVPF